MSNWCKAALAAAVLACVATPAAAEPLAGEWVVRAVNEEIGCTIDGRAILAPRAYAESYDVTMQVAQICAGVETSTSAETCILNRKPRIVIVTCRVVHSTAEGYLPDDFILSESGPDLLVGRIIANWNTPAEWRRLDAVPVS